MKAGYVGPALAAVLVLISALVAGNLYAEWLEDRYVHALAPQMFEQKPRITALQRAAFRQPDLLPLYGSSEMPMYSPYHASALFREYPTGFTVYAVGKPWNDCLSMLQKMAAVGSDLRGKKVAITLSPNFFYAGSTPADGYAGNFSRLHANELAFSTELSHELKQGAARRMLEYPGPLEKDPLLKFALEKLADGSPNSQALYHAALPVGKLQTMILRMQDRWDGYTFIREQPNLASGVPRATAELDWSSIMARAERESHTVAGDNPFGFQKRFYDQRFSEILRQRDSRTNEAFRRSLLSAGQWTDLDLLLRALQELGAEPLILSVPLHGRFFQWTGITSETRQLYYEKLREVAAPYGVRVADFAEHDEDKYFQTDMSHHLSRKGWVHVAQTLDAFYRGALR